GSGLASHGGGLGAIIAVIWYCRRRGVNPMKYMDPSMCAATWVIPWVRVGNFFNSEIVGREWEGPWAVAFLRHCEIQAGRYVCDCPGYLAGQMCEDPVTRHPSQVYEAILAFIMLGIAIYLQRRWRNRLRPGAILFILLAYYFTTRFFIEYVKDYQALSPDFPFTMGQMLSLPIVLFSLYMLFFSKTSNIRSTIAGPEVLDDPPGLDPDERPDDEDDEDDEPPPEKKKKRKKRASASKEADAGEGGSDDAPRPKKRKKKKRKKKS
ncbi:MAG: prolipoprotein diacylglyceryl transferase, partial [Gemmatimonadota bacterium]|nr:prolipoprotein diacylglyceryl transferase [Gemmatimonadota bacterium]